jgi:hypothetical protein
MARSVASAPRHCGAKKKQGKGACHRPPGWGTDHPGQGRCKLHGGGTRSHRQKAARERAAAAVATYGLPREIEPQDALLEEVHRAAGHVAWLQKVISALQKDELIAGVARTVQLPDETTRLEYSAGLSVWVRLYHSERDRLVRVAKAALDAGVAERQVKITEIQARLLADVVTAIVTDLGHDLADEKTRKIVRLRLIEGGKSQEAA